MTGSTDNERRASFGDFVAAAQRRGRLVVQPRMGFSDVERMRSGLVRTKAANAVSVGTLTLDSYTRTGDHEAVRRALTAGIKLNGYPIVALPDERTVALLDGVRDETFPVQVRHGSSRPQDIFRTLARLGLEATEGGPVSYCLPYSRTPLREAVDSWIESTELFAESGTDGPRPHLESFGGCMLGQLCPPGLLVAISLLEGIFFRRHGIGSISLSYAQQTDPAQDEEAVLALRSLAAEFLPDTQWHVVFYAYMGVYPRTASGAAGLMEQAVRTAVRAGAARIIVKTEAEAHRIPGIEENVEALENAARVAELQVRRPRPAKNPEDSETYTEARTLVEAVLDLGEDVGRSLERAFERGLLDVPFCLHPANRGRARSHMDGDGRLRWLTTGDMPIRHEPVGSPRHVLTAGALLDMLHHVEQRYDTAAHTVAGPDPYENAEKTMREEQNGTMTSTASVIPPLGEHLTSSRTRNAMFVQQEVLAAAREYLRGRGFTELLPPLTGPVTDPGCRGAKQLDVDFYGHPYKLMTSAILYKQVSLRAFPKLFYIAPNVRAEPLETASTGRHLFEFHQIDVEMAEADRDEAMRVAAEMLVHIVRRVIENVPEALRELGRDPVFFKELLRGDFDRRSHTDVVATLIGMGHDQDEGTEIDWEGETLVSHKADRPFFVTDYPKGSRGFYDREDPRRPGSLRNFDLLAHGGYGELVSGSERRSDHGAIVAGIRENGEDPAKYGWYLEETRRGIPASAGFGMGLERVTRYLSGLDSLWQVSAYPKLPGVVSP